MTQDSVLQLLNNHTTHFPVEQAFISEMTSFVRDHDNFYQRSNLEGHITGSAWMLSPNLDSVLLIHHRKLGIWFQPGGHVDLADQSIFATAEREALEETGLASINMLTDRIFDIDIHQIPARKGTQAHLHYDIRILGIAESLELNADFNEVSGIKWLNIEKALSEEDKYKTVRRMLLKSQNIKDYIQKNS